MRIPAANLKPLEDAATGTLAGFTYVAATARVADALTQDVLLAPIESSINPGSSNQGAVPGDLQRPDTLFLSRRGWARKNYRSGLDHAGVQAPRRKRI